MIELLLSVRLSLTNDCRPFQFVAVAMSAGNARIELAKITGITPDWFTFSGM